MPTSTELMQLARACAERATLPRRKRRFPSFSEIEDVCGEEYEELLGVLHEDEVYRPADLDAQEQLVAAIRAALPEAHQDLLEALIDNQAAQVWLQQEGAFHLGMAVGLRLAAEGHDLDADDDEEDYDEDDEDEAAARAREDAVRFGPHRNDVSYYDDEDEDKDADEDEDKNKR